MRRLIALLGLLLGLWCPAAEGKTALAVDLGWGGAFHVGRWTPIFVTVADTSPRAAQINVYSSHDPVNGMRVHQTVTLNSQPTTYEIFIPMQNWGSGLSVTINDAQTDRILADWNLMNSNSSQLFYPTEQIIGISGDPSGERLLSTQLTAEMVQAPWIDPIRLPSIPQGYDCFDSLILNQPDLSKLSAEQQTAIIDWVRAGGHLVTWIGQDPPPGSSPILDALPATIGDVATIPIPDVALRLAGLPDRFAMLKGRQLSPYPNVVEIPLLNGATHAYRRDLGLGRITLVAADLSSLLFESPEKARLFWKPVFDAAVDFTRSSNDPSQRGYNAESTRRAQAADQAMNMLGDVPGAGEFGFSYVAMVMVGMMLLVGPVDWIVLKRLGKQPWTWLTTGGWIALITLGAVYIGFIFKSGDLHFRTLRLIDQVDGASIAHMDVAGIYSPRTADYDLKVQPSGWWEPLSPAESYYSSGRSLTDIDFHQDYEGNRPDPMRINVWNLRFLKGDVIETGPPWVDASLTRITRGGRDVLVGTIRNISAAPLSNFAFRLAGGRGLIGPETLAPGATMKVDAPISRERKPDPGDPRTLNAYIRPITVGPESLFDLAVSRSLRIERQLDGRVPYICLFCEANSSPPAATLSPAPTVERDKQYIRALVPMEATTP